MSTRYLFGPVSRAFAEDNLAAARADGACLAFDFQPGADLAVGPDDTWESLQARFPSGWRPDFIALYLPYRTIPACLWSAPVPLVGLAGDWNLLWHCYRRQVPRCELVLCDTMGVERFRRAGHEHVRAFNMYGAPASFAWADWPAVERDIDVLFVGNFNAAVQGERMRWLGRIGSGFMVHRNSSEFMVHGSELGGCGLTMNYEPGTRNFRVLLASDVYGEEYRRLLGRARIVFNRSVREEWNLRVGEALVAGALLFQEAGNREVPVLLADRRECVLYDEENLEELLGYYLEHEEERRTIAEAGRRRVAEFTFERLWDGAVKEIEAELPGLRERVEGRINNPSYGGEDQELQRRMWEALNTTVVLDPRLEEDLRNALEVEPRSAVLENALGLVSACAAGEAFQRAWTADPRHVLAALNLAEVLAEMGRKAEAVEQARRTLAMVDRRGQGTGVRGQGEESWGETPDGYLDGGHYPSSFDEFRVGWERAGWENAGRREEEERAKCKLIYWRLHLLLGQLTGDVVHFAESAQARPDLAAAHVGLGMALGHNRRWAEAAAHLRRALDMQPFAVNVARALWEVLGHSGELAAQQRLAHQYRLLHRAAPAIVPAQAWFQADGLAEGQAKVIRVIGRREFQESYGTVDAARALSGFTPPRDTEVVLALLAQARPQRILEIGTAAGHMTANLTEWSPDDARVFSLGITTDMGATTRSAQAVEAPPPHAFGAQKDHFGKGHKVMLIAADSLGFDFGQIAPIDFAFIDGAHDLRHVLSDSLKVYEVLSPGGMIVWHDFNSPTPWVEVREALEQTPFAEAIEHVEGTEVAFLRKVGTEMRQTSRSQTPFGNAGPGNSVSGPDHSRNGVSGSAFPNGVWERVVGAERGPVCLIWEGGFGALHSLALVNRELCRRLAARGHELSLLPTQTVGADSRLVPVAAELTSLYQKELSGPAEVHVAHQWPPSFEPPREGCWVVMQPWEFGSLPKRWIEPLATQVDELWVPSRFVRDCFIKSGVPAERVQVVPLGIDPNICEQIREPFPLKTRTRFKFLFVGGTIHRKGIDLLLKAYQSVFSDRDNVCLVIKDMGVGSFYGGQTAEKLLAAARAQAHAPEIEYLDRELTADEMASLYLACDCLVHPFRGEGFGLPILEAMSHGLPAIVTGYGPVLDYSSDETAYFVPARERRFAEKKIDGEETVDYPWLVEPDIDALRYLLRRVVENPGEAQSKGEAAQRHVLTHFTWERTTTAVEARLYELRGRTTRRAEGVGPLIRVTAREATSSGAVENQGAYAPRSPGLSRAARVSLCMIVKNEEAYLNACLRSVVDLVDEIVIADTGSTDGTKDIALRFRAKVVDFVWQDSFAAARNESLKHATGDWIIWLDADERLDETNRTRLRTLLDGLGKENVSYLIRQHSPLEGPAHAAAAVDQVRLFPNHPNLRWQHRVHEQILPSLRECGSDVRPTDIVIDHAGFADPASQRPKVLRNLRLLEMELREHPDDAFVLFNLGAVLLPEGQQERALAFLARSLEHSHPQDTLVRKIYALMTRAHHELGQKEEARTVCRRGRAALPTDAELLFWEAILRHESGDLDGAAASLRTILNTPPAHHFMGFDAGLHGYRTRNFLAEIYAQQGKLAPAEAEWSAVVAECPHFTSAWKKLGELWVTQERWPDLEKAVRRIHEDPASAVDATLLWCRALLAQKDFANARKLLERVSGNHPEHRECRALLNQVLLEEGREKHPDEQPPEPHIIVHNGRNGARPRVSLTMIVKNEEANLPDCLTSVADLVDEIVIVDTGSNDGTKEVAARFGARVFDFPWVDSFSAARNESLKHATGDWIFWMDADDRLDAENRERFRRLIDNLPEGPHGFVMKCLCLPNLEAKTGTVVDHMRLFRNHPEMRWRYRVHEQIVPALRKLGGAFQWTDVVIHHVGYRDPALRRRKLERDLRLLLMEQSEQPDDAFTLFNLGSAYQEMEKLEEALPLFRCSLERSDPTDSIVRKLYALIAQCNNHLGKPREALAACREGRVHYADDVEILFQEATAHRHLGDTEAAIRSWEQALQTPPGPHFASMNTGIRGHLTRHNLATAYFDLGRLDPAEAHWNAALAEQPDYVPSLLGKAELALKRRRWQDLEEVLQPLARQAQTAVDAAVLRARMHLDRKEFPRAREILGSAIVTHPRALWPRVILTHVLLQEGKDWQGAEQALRDVLALDPEHKEAQRNLEVLRRQQGKVA